MQVLQDINANVHAEASLDTVVGLHSYCITRSSTCENAAHRAAKRQLSFPCSLVCDLEGNASGGR